MAVGKTVTERAAEFALHVSFDQIPPEVIRHGRLLLTDTFGVAMSCQDLEHARAVRKAVTGMNQGGPCRLWGTRKRASADRAVLYNACLIHGMDYDDTHVGAILHPSAAVVSTAFTVGEMTGASGRQIWEAIVAGWETAVRLGLAAKGRFHDAGFHGTGIAAPFAAACTAARLMGDTEETLIHALGICGSQAAAIQEFLQDGSWTKKLHPGWGAHSALYALELARSGYIGPRAVLEGRFGVWMTHCGGTDGLEEAFADLGTVWHTPEITVKLYPVCHMTHSFIDGMTALMKEQAFRAEDIEEAECRIAKRYYSIVCVPREVKVRPDTDYAMRFSLPYVLAMAAMKGKVSPWEVDLTYAKDPAVCDLMDRICCIADDSKDNPGHFPAHLTVTLKDGRKFVKEQRFETGSRENPLNQEDVSRKLMDNLEPFYEKKQIETMIRLLGEMEQWTGCSEFIDALEEREEEEYGSDTCGTDYQ